jgi:3-hydroxybutyryl-CoA dehydratase
MASEIRQKLLSGLKAGDTFSITRTFTEDDMHLFTGISHDHNPVHFNQEYVKAKGFGGLICHGLHVGSLVTEIGGQLSMLAAGMNFRFRRPVYFGDTITCTLAIDEMDERGRVKCSALFINQKDETVIEGQLFGTLPNKEELALIS